MLTVRTGAVLGSVMPSATVTAVAVTVGSSVPGWAVGLTCAVVSGGMVGRALVRTAHVPGAADLVTLVRLALACGVAALAADLAVLGGQVGPMVALAAAALALDAVDGWVARCTGTASRFGGVFDGEADAFLMLVLSAYVAASAEAWVLGIGLARYAFAAAGRVMPWLRETLRFRYWRKVVTATQGVVLTVAAAGLLPAPLVQAALVLAAALLAESFGRDVVWLWRRRPNRVRDVPGRALPRVASLTVPAVAPADVAAPDTVPARPRPRVR